VGERKPQTWLASVLEIAGGCFGAMISGPSMPGLGNSEVDEWALRHSAYRLDAEVRYFTDLLAWLDDPARGGA
jgi:hypothetical protein